MLPSYDYHGTEIVQAPGVAVIRSEAIHEARVVPLDARPPLPSDIRGYTGDARGYWDNDTLVIESTNFNGRTGAHFGGNEVPTGGRLRLVERFTRVSDGSIEYQITVDDPDTWTNPCDGGSTRDRCRSTPFHHVGASRLCRPQQDDGRGR